MTQAIRTMVRQASYTTVHWLMVGILVLQPVLAEAQQGGQVMPGGSHAPTMDAAANGTMIVRINTPNGAGVSNNTYTDFNVGAGGLILNNSGAIVSTQFAGYIDGNSNLKTSGSASTIINQVVSTKASTLAGYLEVAGRPAQVIVANQNGITCSGCGFINTPWATLTTGVPTLSANGALAGFSVGQGTIKVGGAGLDASGMRLDLFARALEINAGIWADRINVSAGAADVVQGSSADEISVASRTADAGQARPLFALDVAALGGMYAKSIRLIGTEAGLGVNVDGTIASLEKGFSLTSAGDIVLSGKAVATTTATIEAAGNATVSGTVYGAQGTNITAGGTLTNSGLVGSGKDLAATAGGVVSTGTLAAGLNQDGSLSPAGDLAIISPGLVQLSGQTVAPGLLSLSAGSIDLATGSAQAGSATLTAGNITQATQGQLVVAGDLALRGGMLSNAGALQGGSVTFGGSDLVNAGSLVSTGALTLAATGAVQNSGTIEGNGVTSVTAAGIANNGGTLVNLSTADTSIVATGDVLSRLGTIGGNGAVTLSARSLDVGGSDATHQGQLVAGGTLAVTANGGDIAADGGLVSAGGGMSLNAAQGAITARQGGRILGGGPASIQANTVDLSGGTLWTGDLALQATTLTNIGGTLKASGSGVSTITVGTLDNSGGGLIHSDGQDLALTTATCNNAGGKVEQADSGTLTVVSTGGISNQGGGIATNGALQLTAPTLDNTKGVVSAQGATSLALTGALANTGGDIDAAGPLTVHSGAIDNSAGGAIVATGPSPLSLVSSGAITSHGGTIGGQGDVTVSANSIDVSGIGTLDKPGQAGGNGQLSSGGTLTATATNGAIVADNGGLIAAGKDGTLNASGAIQAVAGTINVGGVATLHGSLLDLDGGALLASSFAIQADNVLLRHTQLLQTGAADFTLKTTGVLDYSGTDFTSNGANFTLAAGSIVNEGGALRHAGSGSFSLTATTLDNRGGLIATAGTLSVNAGSLDNAGGRLSSAGDAAIIVDGALGNGAAGLRDANGVPVTGTILAGGGLMLKAGNVDNSGGDMEAAGPITANVTSLTGGQIKSTGSTGGLTLVATGAVAARGGLIASNGATSVQAGSIDIGGGGQLSAATKLDVHSSGTIQADGGSISGSQVAVTAANFVTDGGTVTGKTLDLELGALSNNGGTISATGTDPSRVVVAGTLANSGAIQANSSALTISAGTLSNSGQASGDGIHHYGSGQLAITSASLANSGAITTDGTLVLSGSALTNTGAITSVGKADIAATTSLANEGTIATNANLSLTGGAITNSGTLSGGSGIQAAMTSYDGDNGRLLAGQFDTAGDASALSLVTSGTSSARGGTIAATGATKLTASSIDVGAGGVLGGRSVDASATAGDITAVAGTIQAGTGQGTAFLPGTINLNAIGTIDASGKGAINGSDVALTAAGLRTANGGSLSANNLTAVLGSIDNQGGTIAVTGAAPLTLALAGAFDNSGGGQFGANASDLTLSAASIENAGGSINHAGTGTLALSAANGIDNSGGTIATGGRYALTATTFTNDNHGSLTGPGASTVVLTGALSNQGGVIGADAGLAVHAGAVTNSGTIGSSQDPLAVFATSLVNQGGAVQGNGVTVDVGSGAIDNSAKGVIGSTSALTLNAGSLGNAGGTVHADGDATLTLATLINGGEISAGHGLTATTSKVTDNAGGSLLGDTVAIDAPSFANHGGLVSGASSTQFQVAGLLDNGSGSIGSQHQLTLTAGSLMNGGNITSATQAGGDPASSSTITVAGTVNNLAGGSIWADHDLSLTAGSITNAGSIAAANNATVSAGGIDNSASTGVLGGGNNLALRFGSANLGKLALGNDLSLTTTGDWTNATGQTILAPHDLTVSVAGTLTNAGTVGANHAATLTSSGDLANQAGGVLQSYLLTVNTGGTLTNAGLLDAGSLATLNVGSLANSGKIYGDAVTVNAVGDITNSGATAVIAARSGTLALLTPGNVTNIDNALLYSGGNLVIARTDGSQTGDWGRAASITNSSATIQAQGDGLLAADTITNTRTTFDVATVAIASQNITTPYQQTDSSHRNQQIYTETTSQTQVTGDSGQGQILFGGNLLVNAGTLSNLHSTLSAAGDMTINADSVSNVAMAETQTVNDVGYYHNQYYHHGFMGIGDEWRDDPNGPPTSPLSRQTVTQQGTLTPSVIAAGGNLTLNAGTVQNLLLDASGNTVNASNTLGGSPSGPDITNQDGFNGAGTTSSVGGVSVGGQQSVLGGVNGSGVVDDATGAVRHTLILAVASLESGGTTQAGLATALTGKLATPISLVGGTTGLATLTGNPLTLAAGGMAALGQIVGLPASISAAFHIALGGLFSFAPPGSQYLIETDPAFTNENNFLSSNYFLDRLGYDPSRVEQRLGDAYYEQQLVGRQLTELTGTMRLAGYTDNEDQYRALMNAGAEYAQQFDLALGVGLTPAQMATLTTDIVLLVDVTVQTPSGPQYALAPVVYLNSAHTGDVQNSGALIASGGTLNLRTTGSLTNTGVIRSVAGSNIAAGTTLTNGGVIAGGKVATVSAGGDLVSNAGVFTGGDLTLASGGNMVLGATSANSHTVTFYPGGGVLTDATVHTLTTVNASGNLTVIARGNLTSQGALLTAGDKASIVVGGTANLDAVKDTTSSLSGKTILHGGTFTATTDETVRGTGISGTNGVSIAAGVLDPTAKLVLNGGTISSANGAVALSGTGGVEIGTTNEHHTSDTGTFTSQSGFLSSTSTSTTDKVVQDSAVGSTVSGDTVSITSSKGGIGVTGSNVVASNGVSLDAKDDINITAAASSAHDDYSNTFKKSGLSLSFSGGSLNLFAGTSKASATQVTDATTLTSSVIGTSNGNVSILSHEGDVNVTASKVMAPNGSIGIEGNSVTIAAGQETNSQTETYATKQTGLTISIGSPLLSAASTITDMGQAAKAGDPRLLALAGVASGAAGYNAYAAVKSAPKELGGITVSATLGYSQTSSTSTTNATSAVGSEISAGRDVSIIAHGENGNINIASSSIQAVNDIDLNAKNQVNLTSAQDTFASQTKNSSSSGSIGASATFGAGMTYGLNAGMSKSNGSTESSGSKQVDTLVNAGNTLTVNSGGDTNIVGAVASGNQVIANVGGNLNVQSLQDTSQSQSSQHSTSGSLSVSAGAGFSPKSYGASFSNTSGQASSSYAAVNQQSGIQAGSGGFQINVNGNTSLTGATITSEAGMDKNSLTTGTLTTANLDDHSTSTSSTSGSGLSLSYSPGLSNLRNASNNLMNPGLVNMGQVEGSRQTGVTTSAISPGAISIANGAAQQQLTGKDADVTVAGLNRTPVTSVPLAAPSDAGQLLSTQMARQQATTSAVSAVGSAIATFYQARAEKATEQANQQVTDAQNIQNDPNATKAQKQQAQTLLENAVDLRTSRSTTPGVLEFGLTQGLGTLLVAGIGSGTVNLGILSAAAMSTTLGAVGYSALAVSEKREQDTPIGAQVTCKGAPKACAKAASVISKDLNDGSLPLATRLAELQDVRDEKGNQLFTVTLGTANTDRVTNIASNGISNQLTRAVVMAVGDLSPDNPNNPNNPTAPEGQKVYLAYNETQGAISDIVNVAIDKFIGSRSLNSDAVAKALWAGSNNGTGPVNLFAHSSGTAVANVALNSLANRGTYIKQLTVDYFGASTSLSSSVNAALNAAELSTAYLKSKGNSDDQITAKQNNFIKCGNASSCAGETTAPGISYFTHFNDPISNLFSPLGNLFSNTYNNPKSPSFVFGTVQGNFLQAIQAIPMLTQPFSPHNTYNWNNPLTWTLAPTPASGNPSAPASSPSTPGRP